MWLDACCSLPVPRDVAVTCLAHDRSRLAPRPFVEEVSPMKCVRALLFVLVFSAPAVTQAGPLLPGSPDSLPLLYVCVSDVCLDLSGALRPIEGDGKVMYSAENLPVLIPDLAQLSITALYDPDPSIVFSVTSLNLVPGPLPFAFLFGQSIVPGLYNFAASTGGLSVTNSANATATVTPSDVYPSYISGYGTVALAPTNLGVDLGTAPCEAGPGAPTTTVCNQGTTSNTFPSTFFDNLEALLTYTQDGAGSVAAWTGSVTLEERRVVPEPVLLGLFATGVIGFGWRRLRK
jgi:hypothetical protein